MTQTTGSSTRSRLDPLLLTLWLFACVVAIAQFPVSATLGVTLGGIPIVLSLVLALIQGAGIVLMMVVPRIAVVLSVVALAGFALAMGADAVSPWPVSVVSMIALCVVIVYAAIRVGWRLAVIAWGAGIVAGMAVALTMVDSASAGAATADLIVFGSVSAGALIVGLLLSQGQVLRRQLQRQQQVSAAELARREVAEERTRIARELHDVVAHGMSAIQVQASSARYRIPSLSAEAADEFDELAATARSALAEMRGLLTVLRNDDATSETSPNPGIRDVQDLVARAVRAGWVVELDDRIGGSALPPTLSLTVYRIVQESLSNVARHAVGARTLVTLDRSGTLVTVEVRNAAPEASPVTGSGSAGPVDTGRTGRPADTADTAGAGHTAAPGGHGLRGMRERVALLGGTLEARGSDDGGFVVRAALPVEGSG